MPVGVDADVCTTTVKEPVAPFATNGLVQEMVPPDPTAGVVQVQPDGAEMDWNVVFAGIASEKTAFTAACGPLFVTVWV